MKRILSLLSALIPGVGLLAGSTVAAANDDVVGAGVSEIAVFDEAVFYDGYKTDEIIDASKNDGILRHSNSLYAKKLDMSEFPECMTELKLQVLIGAMCDNYDRMGRVNLVLAEKGRESYSPEDADIERMEIARFITPFMDKNKLPDVVPYVYEVNDLQHLLGDAGLREAYDFWLETEVFGIPYVANQQIAGCEGRNDVFRATVSFSYMPEAEKVGNQAGVVYAPIYVSRSEIAGPVNLNNYREEATDTLGVTTRVFEYEIDRDVTASEVVLILTNHGAGEDGEEYIRRKHLVYSDGELAMVYTPGGVSCEPYRKYNTQRNGIYSTARPPAFWKQMSNWCPGQAVPIRRVELGAMKAGKHKVMIRVPEAEFAYEDGDFRPSLYFVGVEEGELLPAALESIYAEAEGPRMRLAGDAVLFEGGDVHEVSVYSIDGMLIEGRYNPGMRLELSGYAAGQYIVVATDSAGNSSWVKFSRQ